LVGANAKARQALGWTPKLGELDTIVRTAWQWHERMPNGYAQ
jgi:UDP-glucose 4-epimerase